MEEMAAASSEQASGIDELNRAIAQIDNTTQQNAAIVEELASTSDHLNSEARELAEIVSRFKVKGFDAESQRTSRAASQSRPKKTDVQMVAPSNEYDFEEF